MNEILTQILEVEEKEKQLLQQGHEFQSMAECTSCEIAVLSELIEVRSGTPIPPQHPVQAQLQSILSEVVRLNERMVAYLKQTTQRRTQSEAVIRKLIS